MNLRHVFLPIFVAAATPALLIAQGHTVPETEPNNSFDNANLIQLHDTIDATIGYNGDVDYYAVDLPAGTKLFITMAPNSCWGLGLVSPDRQTTLLSRHCYTEHGDSLHTTIQTAGRYYVIFSNNDDEPGERVDPPMPYKLRVGVYQPPPPGPGNPMRLVATDEGRIDAMVAAPDGGVVFIDETETSGVPHVRLRRMSADGQFSTIATDVEYADQIAIDAFGDVLVPNSDGVRRYSLATGAHTLFTGPSTGTFPYRGITVGADGDVWLSDPGTFQAGAVLSRFDALGNLKEKIPIPVGRVFILRTAQNGDVFFQTQDVGDIYRLVNNAAPQRVIAADGNDARQGAFELDQDGWVYVAKSLQGQVRLYNAQYQLARDPLAQVLDSIHWSGKQMATVMAWMRDGNGNMTSRLLTVRVPPGDFTPHSNELLEVNHAGMGAAGADPMLRVTSQSLRPGAKTISYADTLRLSGTSTSATWSMVSGHLPSGLALSASTGVISGTPSETGSFDFAVKASAGSRAGFARLSVTVVEAPTVAVSLPDVVNALLGGPAVSAAVVSYLDKLGNNNGKLDVGDLRAYLHMQGLLSGSVKP